MKKFAILAALAVSFAAPALAQNAAEPFAKDLAKGSLNLKAWPIGQNIPVIDEKKDPWIAMSSNQMAASQPATERKRSYAVSTQVDYNNDGIMDIAYLANNKSQGAVLVRLGGNKGTVVAFKARKRWAGGQEIAGGGRRIALVFPESSVVFLSSESGKPAAYYMNEGD